MLLSVVEIDFLGVTDKTKCMRLSGLNWMEAVRTEKHLIGGLLALH